MSDTATTEAALELDVDAAGYTRGEGVHFGGFPGIWYPERPVAVSELGLDHDVDVAALVEELGLPLTLVDVPHGSAPMPEQPNRMLSEEDAMNAPGEEGPRFRSHADANARAAELGLEFEEKKPSIAEKTRLIEEAEGAEG